MEVAETLHEEDLAFLQKNLEETRSGHHLKLRLNAPTFLQGFFQKLLLSIICIIAPACATSSKKTDTSMANYETTLFSTIHINTEINEKTLKIKAQKETELANFPVDRSLRDLEIEQIADFFREYGRKIENPEMVQNRPIQKGEMVRIESTDQYRPFEAYAPGRYVIVDESIILPLSKVAPLREGRIFNPPLEFTQDPFQGMGEPLTTADNEWYGIHGASLGEKFFGEFSFIIGTMGIQMEAGPVEKQINMRGEPFYRRSIFIGGVAMGYVFCNSRGKIENANDIWKNSLSGHYIKLIPLSPDNKHVLVPAFLPTKKDIMARFQRGEYPWFEFDSERFYLLSEDIPTADLKKDEVVYVKPDQNLSRKRKVTIVTITGRQISLPLSSLGKKLNYTFSGDDEDTRMIRRFRYQRWVDFLRGIEFSDKDFYRVDVDEVEDYRREGRETAMELFKGGLDKELPIVYVFPDQIPKPTGWVTAMTQDGKIVTIPPSFLKEKLSFRIGGDDEDTRDIRRFIRYRWQAFQEALKDIGINVRSFPSTLPDIISRQTKIEPARDEDAKLELARKTIELGRTDDSGELTVSLSDAHLSCKILASNVGVKTYRINIGNGQIEIPSREIFNAVMTNEEKLLYAKHLVTLTDENVIEPDDEYLKKFPKGCMSEQVITDYLTMAHSLRPKAMRISDISQHTLQKIRVLTSKIMSVVSQSHPLYPDAAQLYAIVVYFGPDHNYEEAIQVLETITTTEAKKLLSRIKIAEEDRQIAIQRGEQMARDTVEAKGPFDRLKSMFWRGLQYSFEDFMTGRINTPDFLGRLGGLYVGAGAIGLADRIRNEGAAGVFGDALRSMKYGADESALQKQVAEYEEQRRKIELEAQRSKCEQKCKDNYKTCTSSDTYPVPIPLPNTPAAVCVETKTQCLQSCQ